MRLSSDFLPFVALFFPDSPFLLNSTRSANDGSVKASPTASAVSTSSATPTTLATPAAKKLLSTAGTFASSLRAAYPDPNVAVLAEPIWWWQSGSAVDALLTYTSVTGDSQYAGLLSSTLVTEATSKNDFMTVHATGNDDQAWWALAALTAAESNLSPAGPVPWATLAQNVFNAQTARWDKDKCNGGMKWKIEKGDGTTGWHYKSTIANGLFFQLAARLALHTGSADMQAWAQKSYDWTVSVGLISPQFDVYDGTDDAKGENGCVDVNHDMWSYNVGVFMYGCAVMAKITNDDEWLHRTKGLIASAKRNFVNAETGELWESKCEGDGSCDSDQVSFKGTLARWLGATAVLLPELRDSVGEIVTGASGMATAGTTAGLDAIASFNQLEMVDAGLRLQGGEGMIAARSVAGRVSWATS
ncbi:hydrolase 76 protein [Neodidymelliopsis sp. IMI 364377]|nr:hydrolase 76 protein [Neodidymelliopsis sp. IMI 364377]